MPSCCEVLGIRASTYELGSGWTRFSYLGTRKGEGLGQDRGTPESAFLTA